MVEPAARKTVKQERDERRAEKVAAYQRQRAAEQRRRRIALISGVVGAVAILGLLVTFIATAAPRQERPQDMAIPGLQEYPGLPANHVTTPVDYEAEYGAQPPAGGDHHPVWLNCGVYEQPQPNENAVHALEHGAVWVTYDPDAVSGEELASLRDALPDQYVILSPFPGLPAPIVASAWGAQIQMDSPDDERLQQFIDRFWKSADAPEPGAACTGAIDGPGRVA
ncbi:DUF3105 domain-containing protein [Leucobacter massiliensis]|uniref:DUF3105 domain-containing protein n=1 Tax=Leucobacter massiliensis TaxID=1686285 RepID=A0A2S9QL33_9MICO|nr:DUF3105 domain-containing protein [Leucobacter massiliensis]PRI10294.1 hypothetical protein B4915_12955 [Leucobacter massiliensis]